MDPEFYDACGIITPQGMLTLKRVLHGLKNAAAHFHAHVTVRFQATQDALKSCLDDLIIYADSVEGLLGHLASFLEICLKHQLNLSPKKCTFFQVLIRCCGRATDTSGYKLYPQNIEAI